MTQHVIETLPEAECFKLIGQKLVGRFVFQDADGPAAVPVNFGIAGEQVIFRTERASHLRQVLDGPVAFEVDQVEPETGGSWSVLIRGVGEEIDTELLPALLRRAGKDFPHPWGDGVHNVWVAITPRKVTGRRLTAPYLAAIF